MQTNNSVTPSTTSKNTLRQAFLLALVAAIFYFLMLFSIENKVIPIGTLRDALSEAQDKTLDYVSRFEYLRPSFQTPAVSKIRLVSLDNASVAQYSPSGLIFNRNSLTSILEKIEKYRPAAVFVDIALVSPTNQTDTGSSLSKGDLRLLEFLRKSRTYPILIPTLEPRPKAAILGQPASSFPKTICFVSPKVLRDSDGMVRRVPRPQAGGYNPASLALYQIATGLYKGCPPIDPQASSDPYLIHGSLGNRMLFRKPENWKGFATVTAQDLLGNLLAPDDLEGAIVLVGRTDQNSFDEHITPIGRMSGVQLHASELLTLASYQRHVRPLSIWLAPIILLLVLWPSMVWTPLVLGWVFGFVKNQPWKKKLAGFFEPQILWLILFLLSSSLLHYGGWFFDFILPITSLEFARSTLGNEFANVLMKLTEKGLKG